MKSVCAPYTDAELASELIARGYRVLRPGDFREVEVCETRTAYEIQQRMAISPQSFAAEIHAALVERLSEVLIGAGPLTVRRYQDTQLRASWKAGLLAFDPEAPFQPFSPEERPAPAVQDDRPSNCRDRLQAEGKAYPRSGCAASGCGGVFARACRPSAALG